MLAAPLITSTRMYDVGPTARTAWHAVLRAAYRRAGITVGFIEHGWPTPIAELWARPGLCGAFMCGWPYAQARHVGKVYTAVAAVVPDWPQYEGLPRYRSEFLVREVSPWADLQDTLGSRYGWMVRDSQSGWNAPRKLLARLAADHGPVLFAASKGPYGNPRGLLRALLDSEIDITAVDGWYLDLLRVHDPAALQGLRTLAYTPWTPNPPLVCGPDVDAAVCRHLAQALHSMHLDSGLSELLRQARVARFVPVDATAYEALLDTRDDGAYPEIR
jgi:ABC-type phosphate/phosphonate transport system substrate-binding protein